MLGRVFRIFQEAGHVRIGGGVETLLRERGGRVAQTRDPKGIFLNGKVDQKPYYARNFYKSSTKVWYQ